MKFETIASVFNFLVLFSNVYCEKKLPMNDYQRIDLTHTVTMESSRKIGCTIRNQKDPYQFHCAFSTEPEEKREFSVYFYSPDGSQELMVSCTRNKTDDCLLIQKEGLTATEDYITVSETFPKQAGRFVCQNGGPPSDQFPCLYSGNSVKPEGIIENGSNSSLVPENLTTEDNNLAVILSSVFGVVILLQFLVIAFLLVKNYKSKKGREAPDSPTVKFIKDVCTAAIPLLVDENKASSINQNAIDEKTNGLNGKGDKHYDLSHLTGKCISNKNDKDHEISEDPALEKTSCVSVNKCVPENNNNASNKNRDCFETPSNHLGSDHGEPHECSKKIDEYTGLTSVRVCDSEKNGEALEL